MGQDPERDRTPTDHDELSDPASGRKSIVSKQSSAKLPAIPRAPALPKIAPPPDATPSYAPASVGRRSEITLELSEPALEARDTIRHASADSFELSEPAPLDGRAGPTHRSPPPPLEDGERRIWDPIELELLDGRQRLVIEKLERAAGRSVEGVGGAEAVDELPMLASLAAGFFTTAPVFCHFAPFDLSLFSIARIEAALGVVYGKKPCPAPASDASPILLLLGAYLGECLRQSYGGDWQGSTALSETTRVEAPGCSWRPFRVVRQRLERAAPLSFEDPGAVHPELEPFAQRLSIPLAPPAPWDPDPWPGAELVPELGAALPQSIVGAYCSLLGGGALDFSAASLAALDGYLELIAPSRAPKAHDLPWVRRASVIAGAYLGEVLGAAAGAHWASSEGTATGPRDYTLALPGGSTVRPVLAAYERLRGGRVTSLFEYAGALLR